MNVESVWEYPRPPRLERVSQRIRVVHQGVKLADTLLAWRIVETSHPPTYYLPPDGPILEMLKPSAASQSFCEFKGVAGYWDFVGAKVVARACRMVV